MALLVMLAGAADAYAAPDVEPTVRSPAGACAAAEKQRRQRALAAYQQRAARDRAAFFRTHRSATARRAFVKRQEAKLKALRRAAQCTVASPPPPPPLPPLPPAPEPPPPIPVAAPVVAGAGVPADQVELVERSLALANGFFKVRLGRELSPSFRVYIFSDLEGIAAAYAEHTGNPIAFARQLWESGTTAVAQSRGMFVYLGSQSWTQSPESLRMKIVAHEAFHLLQGELAGPETFNSGPTDIPTAGPRWLSEGAAEYFAYRVVAENRLVKFESTVARWRSVVKTMTTPLAALENATGFGGLVGVYDLTPLAASRLIEPVGEAAFVAFWGAIGQGTPWPAAFTAAFSRSLQAFYDEFAAFRRGL